MFEAVGPGVAHVTVTVGGVTSAAQTITVIAPQTMLMHRYSFNEAAANPAAGLLAHDSVGVQDGLIWGLGSALTGTKLTLTPNLLTYTNDKNNYVELPAGLINSYDAVSIDVWFTAGFNRQWNRIYDLGYQSAAGSGVGSLYATTRNGSNLGQVDGSDGGTDINKAQPMSFDTNTWHLTVVYDKPGTSTMWVYTNGVLSGSASISTPLIPRNIIDIHNYIGRSQANGDGALNATYDEFRIYAGALSSAQVAAIHSAGANSLTTLPPRLSMTPSGANLVFSWPTTTGFTLKQSTAGISPLSGYTAVGTPTTSGILTTVTVPAPTTSTFFILSNP
jgi:hypothetical protein